MKSLLYNSVIEAEKLGKELTATWSVLEADTLKTMLDESGHQTKRLNQKQMLNKGIKGEMARRVNATPNLTKDEIDEYDVVIVAFSGGKDSLACFLHLLDIGVARDKIELWHHDIDGQEGSNLMDWNCTRSYCKRFAEAFGVKIYFSWKKHGFEGEMLRENSLTQPTCFETPEGTVVEVGGKTGKPNTRLKFPQVAADLSTRWCSSYLKISVCSTAINNQPRFTGKTTLLLTGERAEESSNRASYFKFEKHSSNGKKRTVHQYRPVHSWKEQRVWDLIEKYRVNPHPAYKLGWGRVSCMTCIFGNKDQWASVAKIAPKKVEKISQYETQFGITIQRKQSVEEMVEAGTAYDTMKDSDVNDAMSHEYNQPIILSEGQKWEMPAGAFGDSCGPI